MTSRPAVPPVVLASTFVFEDAESMARSVTEHDSHLYSRWSNPTVEALEADVARLEGASACVAFGSGMAAVHAALLAAIEGAPALAVQREIYGGTHELLGFASWPCPVSRFSLVDAVKTAAALPEGAVILLELPTNPTVRVVDLEGVRAAAPNATIIVDATFASPVLSRPLEHGADLVVHSATKYLAGHHDVVAGVVSGSDLDAVWRVRKVLGAVLDPAAAYRVWRGLRTLKLRVTQQNATAELLSARLEEHPRVLAVHHPSLPSHPDHGRLGGVLKAGGGVFSFDVADPSAVLNRLTRFELAPSLGGTNTLITWAAGVTHANVSPRERAKAGVTEGLLRVAVGLEDAEELWADLEGAL